MLCQTQGESNQSKGGVGKTRRGKGCCPSDEEAWNREYFTVGIANAVARIMGHSCRSHMVTSNWHYGSCECCKVYILQIQANRVALLERA